MIGVPKGPLNAIRDDVLKSVVVALAVAFATGPGR